MDRTLPSSLVVGLLALAFVVTGAMYLPISAPMATGVASVHVADVNSDNALDVLSASGNRDEIAWHRNDDGSFTDRTTILERAGGVKSVFADDLDGDGDPDVLSTSIYSDRIAWYENTDGYGDFSDQKVIEDEAGNPLSVYATDLDGDDDSDILYASNGDGKIAWYENENGQGNFSGQNIISTAAPGAQAVYAADLDGDGDKDALSASSSYGGDDRIGWYRNTAGGFASQNVITKNLAGARSVYAADLDGDGDNDVLSASKDDGKIAWYENTSGYGTFSDQKVISTNAPDARSVHAADLDGDGDLDVLSASETLAWYENTDGQGTFSTRKVISGSDTYGTVMAADMDADGDPDVLSASQKGNRIVWFSNDIEQGQGFSNAQSIVQRLAEK